MAFVEKGYEQPENLKFLANPKTPNVDGWPHEILHGHRQLILTKINNQPFPGTKTGCSCTLL